MDRRYTRRRLLTLAATAAVAVPLAGCTAPAGDDDGDDAGDRTVQMTNALTFDPATLSVAPGTTVVFDNVGSLDHSVTAYEDELPEGADYFASGGFDAEQAARDGYPEGALGGGDTYEHVFEATGTYEYFCIPHEGSGMTGTIEVS